MPCFLLVFILYLTRIVLCVAYKHLEEMCIVKFLNFINIHKRIKILSFIRLHAVKGFVQSICGYTYTFTSKKNEFFFRFNPKNEVVLSIVI